MGEIPYGRMNQWEQALGGRDKISTAFGRSEQLAGVRMLTFEFKHDMAGLRSGVEFYHPSDGDILIDAWVEILTAWDGTTPSFDFATFHVNGFGVYNLTYAPVRLDNDPDAQINHIGVANGQIATLSSLVMIGNVATLLRVPAIASVPSAAQSLDYGPFTGEAFRGLPGRMSGDYPLKMCVSQDGSAGGPDPGATKGEALFHLLVASPQRF